MTWFEHWIPVDPSVLQGSPSNSLRMFWQAAAGPPLQLTVTWGIAPPQSTYPPEIWTKSLIARVVVVYRRYNDQVLDLV